MPCTALRCIIIRAARCPVVGHNAVRHRRLRSHRIRSRTPVGLITLQRLKGSSRVESPRVSFLPCLPSARVTGRASQGRVCGRREPWRETIKRVIRRVGNRFLAIQLWFPPVSLRNFRRRRRWTFAKGKGNSTSWNGIFVCWMNVAHWLSNVKSVECYYWV